MSRRSCTAPRVHTALPVAPLSTAVLDEEHIHGCASLAFAYGSDDAPEAHKTHSRRLPAGSCKRRTPCQVREMAPIARFRHSSRHCPRVRYRIRVGEVGGIRRGGASIALAHRTDAGRDK